MFAQMVRKFVGAAETGELRAACSRSLTEFGTDQHRVGAALHQTGDHLPMLGSRLRAELLHVTEQREPAVRLHGGEIVERGTLDARQRALITLVALVAGQTLDEMKQHTEAALRAGATPVEIRESIYQCAPYVGFPRTESALRLVNEVFTEQGIALPLQTQGTVKEETRFRDGVAVQKKIFGEAIDKATAEASLISTENKKAAPPNCHATPHRHQPPPVHTAMATHNGSARHTTASERKTHRIFFSIKPFIPTNVILMTTVTTND